MSGANFNPPPPLAGFSLVPPDKKSLFCTGEVLHKLRVCLPSCRETLLHISPYGSIA